MTTEERVRLAASASIQGVPPREARTLARAGWDALRSHLADLSSERRDQVDALTADLMAQDVGVTAVGEESYPRRLLELRTPPAFLFLWGNLELLERRGVGMCGSREASARGLHYARTFGRSVVERGMQVVSGYARGVDMETHLGALEAHGKTVIVLAEGIRHFRLKRELRDFGADEDNVLAISQFPPTQRWTAGGAMTRNGTIAALSEAVLVIEAKERGGTLNAGLQAMEIGRPVFAIRYEDDLPEGNRILFGRGAHPLRSKAELLAALDSLAGRSSPHQLALDDI